MLSINSILFFYLILHLRHQLVKLLFGEWYFVSSTSFHFRSIIHEYIWGLPSILALPAWNNLFWFLGGIFIIFTIKITFTTWTNIKYIYIFIASLNISLFIYVLFTIFHYYFLSKSHIIETYVNLNLNLYYLEKNKATRLRIRNDIIKF